MALNVNLIANNQVVTGGGNVSAVQVKSSEDKLSDKAKSYLDDLRKQYGDYDFIVADAGDNKRELVKQSNKEYSVVLTSSEVERMSSSPKYAKEKLDAINTSVRMSDRIGRESGYERAWGRDGVKYDKGEDNSAVSGVISKSQTDRTAIVNQLKADMEQRKQQMLDIVSKTLQGQTGALGKATGDNVWKTLAGGNFTVDAATKAQAAKDIAEDGYWGVKQTSQRLFDFASALAGDDVDKMKEMQAAMEKGFKQATKTWGKELPQISHDTLAAANKLFDDYYASKSV